jgi:GNAT superfamily N-acetyltransferase
MIQFRTELFASFVKDARPLFTLHWEELALNKDKIKLSLDYSKYEKAEKDGLLHIVTARDKGQLVGYYTAAILPHLHYSDAGLMASTDMYFMLPEYRKGNNGALFLVAIEKTLKDRGVKKVYISCKAHHDLSPLFEALGYTFSDKMFTRMLD